MGSRLCVLALAVATAAACDAATEGRAALAEASGIDRVLLRATVRQPHGEPGELDPEPADLDPGTRARGQLVSYAAMQLHATDAVVDGQYRGIRVRIIGPLEPVEPAAAEAGVSVQAVFEAPDLLSRGAPALPAELRDVPLWSELFGPVSELGPRADVVLEAAPSLPAARPLDPLWSDGVLEVSVFCQHPLDTTARDAAFALGEALERWGLHVLEGSADEWTWRRAYEGSVTLGSRDVLVRAQLAALRLWFPGEEVPPEARAASSAFVQALGSALSAHDVVVLVGQLDGHPEGVTLDGLGALLAPDRDQAVLVDGADPVRVARVLTHAARSPGRILWVAGAQGDAFDPIGALQLLGPLLAPGEPTRHPSIDEVPWELFPRVYHASYELVAGAP